MWSSVAAWYAASPHSMSCKLAAYKHQLSTINAAPTPLQQQHRSSVWVASLQVSAMRLKQTVTAVCVVYMLLISFSTVWSHSTVVATGAISLALPGAVLIRSARDQGRARQSLRIIITAHAAHTYDERLFLRFLYTTAQAVALQQQLQQQETMHAD